MNNPGCSGQSESSLEIYFLIAKFLSGGPCTKTTKALEEELKEKGLLPARFDFTGNKRVQTVQELSERYPHITSDTLLKVCERLRDVQQKDAPLGTPLLSSFLSVGRYSLLRCNSRPPVLPPSRIFARRRGCSLQHPAGHSPVFSLVPALEGRRTSGPMSRKQLIWPKLYSRIQLLNQTLGHISAVYCVLFDQTGHFIFTGADDLLVKVWSTVSGRLLATFRGASSEITDLAVNLENTLLAAGSLDRVLYVWCLQTTYLVAQLSAPVGMITGVNFCPTSCGLYRYLASTSTDGSVAFWVYTHQPVGRDTVFQGTPVLFNEKMRPGVAQMICSAFSPGGTFLAAGSADHHVRVYLIPGNEGPQRIMEEEAHSDRVDSIQWANHGLRFVSGSKDGTALVWRFARKTWSSLRLDITVELPGYQASEEQLKQKPKVSMVSWDRTDRWIVTAVHDASLKVWNSDSGALVHVLRTHRRDVFVLEPHPSDEGILLSAGHDGLLCIWDIRTGACLLQHQNLIDGYGHGSIYDAKWSPDGTLIAATDSHGHILLFGFGAANQLLKEVPKQLFFNTDYWPLLRDETRGLLDETTGDPPHMMAAPFLVDVDGTPYPPQIQRLVPGREFEDDCSAVAVPRSVVYFVPNNPIRENAVAPAYFPSAELASFRGNTQNAWQTRMLLPTLHPPMIRQIREAVDAMAKEERLEYDQQNRLPAVSPQKQSVTKVKQRKKRVRRPQTYRTRAATEESTEFVHPESLDLSLSSNPTTESSSASVLDSDSSESSSSSEYSDWIADHGVSLEPPTRSRRRRPPTKLSPSPTPRRKRIKEPRANSAEMDDSDASELDEFAAPVIKDVPAEFLPPKWLSEVVPRKAPYYPQMGDHVMFFQEGYKLYLDVVRKKQVYKPSTRDSLSKLNLGDPIFVQVIGIKYEIRPPRLCCLRLAVMDTNGTMTSKFFNIKYHDVPDVIDFLVLKQTYDIAMSRSWKPGDRFRCMIDDSWWLGSIVSTRTDVHFTDSPFLSLMTKWDNGEDEPMSPWDLEPVDDTRQPPEPGGSVDILPEETLTLLYSPRAEEWPDGDRDGTCERIIGGFELVMTLSIAEAFSTPVDLTLYPSYAISVEYPIDLSTIKARLENRFYRRLTAVQFDVRYLATNAEKFNDVHSQIVKHARIVSDLCLKIIKQPSALDVMGVYHQLVEGYQSSSEGEETGVELQADTASSGPYAEVNWRGDCERLLREMSALPDAAPFRDPVDLQEFPDYLQVVDTPMDLGTVREELMAGNYSTPRDFYDAVRLIFTNSKTYNTNKRSRIFSMSVRLSNLFEARIKQLTSEWKASRRRRIKEMTKARKLRLQPSEPQPGPSRLPDSEEEIVVDPLKTSEDEETSEQLPCTSGRVEPIRLTIVRRWSPTTSRDASDSDDDTNLSALRCNYLKRSGSEDDRSKSQVVEDSESQSVDMEAVRTNFTPTAQQNGAANGEQDGQTTEDDGDDYQVLATLRNNMKANNIEVNGHSYAKPSLENQMANGNGVIDGGEVVAEPEVSEGDSEANPLAAVQTNGCGEGSTTPDPDNNEDSDSSSSSWSEDAGAASESGSGSVSDSASSPSSRYNKRRPGRRKSRRTRNHKKTMRTRARRRKREASDSDDSLPLARDHRLPQTSDSEEEDDSDGEESEESEPVRKRTSRRRAPETDRNKRTRHRSTESEDSPPNQRKRRRCATSDSASSGGWRPSDSGGGQNKRSMRTRFQKKPSSASEDSEEPPSVAVSSRGRVRKLTERAREALKRRNN